MNTNVRIILDDDQRRQYKEVFGETASRANIKVRTAILFFEKLGVENPQRTAVKSINLSDKALVKVRKKLGMKTAEKKKFTLKK